ncbi:E3 ubiquitin-protein ligase Topors-like [Cyrtonyx montezumae]|uniref:E3 ubiquitin-protein ligase Topors-like n=1 Tax=Cyrtonyx montezumae TaxID=9017 RepID=UPI0032DA3711
MPGDTFSDSTCPICLDRFDNVAYVGYCWHRFCFRCIQKWSETSVECPLCKHPFSSIFHKIHAEDDFQEYKVRPLEENALSSAESSSIITPPQSPWNLDIDDLNDYDDSPTPSDEEGSGSDSTVSTTCPGSEHGSPLSGDGQSPWDDETPGPSSFILTTASLWELSEHSDEDCAGMRTLLQCQLHDNDFSSSESSLEHHGPCVCINFYTRRSLSMQFSDSEDSSKEETREDVKEEEANECCSSSDNESSRASSPHSPLYREHGSCCQSPLPSVVKETISKDEQKNQEKITDPSPNDSVWSLPPGMDDTCSSCRQKSTRKTRNLQACPQNRDDGHGHRPWRECHSKHQLQKRQARSRDGSKRPSKRSTRSRPRDTSLSLKSQRDSSSCESTTSKDSSRSPSPHKGHGQRKSSCRRSDCCSQKACYCSGCKWDYPSCSQKAARDGSSCSKEAESQDHCSSETADPELRIQSPTGTTDLQSQSGLRERQDSRYEQCRSRSLSNTTSSCSSGQTDRMRSKKPCVKRKYKTRHLENAEEGSTGLKGQNGLKRTFSEGSPTDNQASSETPPKKKKEEKSEQGESAKEKQQKSSGKPKKHQKLHR